MAKSIIKEIFYGTRGNCEGLETTAEYKRLANETYELSLKLEKDFTPEQKEAFDKLSFLEAGLQSENALVHFSEGFKIGLLIGIEAKED